MNASTQNIFLIGPMGSGKTTIGRQLAKILDLEFFDCDQELERLTGASVNLIFDVEGEAGFRTRETRVLDTLTAKKGVLVATGGGVVCSEKNRQMLRSRGLVVYLKTSIKKQLRRLDQDKSRPLLQAEDRQQRLLDLAQVRNPLYDLTADLVFRTRNSSVRASAKMLSSAVVKTVETLKLEAPHADS
jgi:shikimate kinase